MYKLVKAERSDFRDRLLSSDGYSYLYHRSGPYGKIYRCTLAKRKCACTATVKHHDGRFIRGEKAHNHGPKMNELTIKSEVADGLSLDLQATCEMMFSPFQVGIPAKKTYRVAARASRRGRDLLIDSDGFKYTYRKKLKKMVIWHCSVRSKTLTCHATVSQRGADYVPGPKPHVHTPDSNKPFGWVATPRKSRNAPDYCPPEASTPAAPNQDLDGAVYTVVANNGKERLVASDGFTYVHKRIGVHSTQWRCNARSNNNICMASVRQYEDMFVIGKQQHIHEPNPDLITTPNIRRHSSILTQKQPGEPNSTHTDEDETNKDTTSSQGDKTYKVVAKATQTGGDLMVDSDGYRYTVKRREGRVTGWKCAVRNKFCSCSASVVQSGGSFKFGRHAHKHGPNSNKPYGMEEIERKKKPKVERRTHHVDDGYKGNPFEDEYGNKYAILQNASKMKTDKLICSDGFSYTARRIGVHGTQWKCLLRSQKCLGSVRQHGELFVRGIPSHTHPAETNLLTGSFGDAVQTTPTMYTSNGKTYSILHKASKAGKNILEDSDGFRYNFKSAGPNAITWRCSVRNSNITCPASVKQVLNQK